MNRKIIPSIGLIVILLVPSLVLPANAITIGMGDGEGALLCYVFLFLVASNHTVIYETDDFNISIVYFNIQYPSPMFAIIKQQKNVYAIIEYYFVNSTKIIKFGELGINITSKTMWVEWPNPDFTWNKREWALNDTKQTVGPVGDA